MGNQIWGAKLRALAKKKQLGLFCNDSRHSFAPPPPPPPPHTHTHTHTHIYTCLNILLKFTVLHIHIWKICIYWKVAQLWNFFFGHFAHFWPYETHLGHFWVILGYCAKRAIKIPRHWGATVEVGCGYRKDPSLSSKTYFYACFQCCPFSKIIDDNNNRLILIINFVINSQDSLLFSRIGFWIILF